jgi:ankyrin repeat protein
MIVRRYAALGVVLGAVTLSAAGENLRLIDAVKQGNFPAAKALIAQKANVNAASRYGMTPIIFAAENGDPKVVAALLKAGANPNSALPEGQTALMTAARTGNVDTIKLLVETGAKVDTKEQWQGQTALMWAASQNNGAAVKALIDAGADKNERSKLLSFPEFKWETSGMVVTVLPRGGWTPLMYAARDGAIDAVAALADAKADLNASDPDGTTALLYAITNAHFDTAAVLIEKGADPNVADSTGTTALYSAVDMHTMGPMLSRPSPKLVDKLDAADIVRLLIAKGANVNARLKRPIIGRHHTPTGDASLGEGTTPLARAAKSNDLQLMRLLLDAGADPKLTLKDRTTVLTIAAAGGAVVGAYAVAIPVTEESSIEAIKLCLDRGVDINAFNTQGTTAVHAAVQRGAEKVVRFLAEHGAKLDMKNKQGRTPLDIALGVGATAGRGGGGRRGGGAPRDTMATLLRSLLAEGGAPAPGTPGAPAQQ